MAGNSLTEYRLSTQDLSCAFCRGDRRRQRERPGILCHALQPIFTSREGLVTTLTGGTPGTGLSADWWDQPLVAPDSGGPFRHPRQWQAEARFGELVGRLARQNGFAEYCWAPRGSHSRHDREPTHDAACTAGEERTSPPWTGPLNRPEKPQEPYPQARVELLECGHFPLLEVLPNRWLPPPGN
jgi:hypothetical protein